VVKTFTLYRELLTALVSCLLSQGSIEGYMLDYVVWKAAFLVSSGSHEVRYPVTLNLWAQYWHYNFFIIAYSL